MTIDSSSLFTDPPVTSTKVYAGEVRVTDDLIFWNKITQVIKAQIHADDGNLHFDVANDEKLQIKSDGEFLMDGYIKSVNPSFSIASDEVVFRDSALNQLGYIDSQGVIHGLTLNLSSQVPPLTELEGTSQTVSVDFVINSLVGSGATVQPSLSITSPVYITPDTSTTITPVYSTSLGSARVIENDVIVTKDYAGSLASTTVAPFTTSVAYNASSSFSFSATFNAGTVVPIDSPSVAYPGGTVSDTLVVIGEYPITTTNETIQPAGRSSLTFTITGATHYIEIHEDVTTASSISVQIQDDNFNPTTTFTFNSVTNGYRRYIDTSIVGNVTETYILNLATL
jgi:hypothetical protein